MSSETIVQNHTRTHTHASTSLISVTVSLKYCDTMKHETAERKQDKDGEVFIATRKELKYLIEK